MGFGLDEFAVMPSGFPEDLDKKGILLGRVEGGRARNGWMEGGLQGRREKRCAVGA